MTIYNKSGVVWGFYFAEIQIQLRLCHFITNVMPQRESRSAAVSVATFSGRKCEWLEIFGGYKAQDRSHVSEPPKHREASNSPASQQQRSERMMVSDGKTHHDDFFNIRKPGVAEEAFHLTFV
ncbi:uncharacterized protein V6R79_013668 [Siganus canaliculatus]